MAIKAVELEKVLGKGQAEASLAEEIFAMQKLDHPACVLLLEVQMRRHARTCRPAQLHCKMHNMTCVQVIEDLRLDTLFMVVEYCAGGTLEDSEPMAHDTCRLLATDLLLALEYLHSWVHTYIWADITVWQAGSTTPFYLTTKLFDSRPHQPLSIIYNNIIILYTILSLYGIISNTVFERGCARNMQSKSRRTTKAWFRVLNRCLYW